jgi:2-polyprenyl-3-methyl-5-hydroxy-6-metoxy-1,4-benzoquinol methylase
MSLIETLRKLWVRFWLRNTKFNGRYGNLKRLYAIKDPWHLDATKERARFDATNSMVQAIVPQCNSLLEIGCGEGLQTLRLLEVSRSVTGIDVSALAIQRARLNCPKANFVIGEAERLENLFPYQRFDLVTAFEVLYYAPDIGGLISNLQKLSDRLLVTNYLARAENMRQYFSGEGWAKLDTIVVGDTAWECYIWRKP